VGRLGQRVLQDRAAPRRHRHRYIDSMLSLAAALKAQGTVRFAMEPELRRRIGVAPVSNSGFSYANNSVAKVQSRPPVSD
jgi:hypothetical protein